MIIENSIVSKSLKKIEGLQAYRTYRLAILNAYLLQLFNHRYSTSGRILLTIGLYLCSVK